MTLPRGWYWRPMGHNTDMATSVKFKINLTVKRTSVVSQFRYDFLQLYWNDISNEGSLELLLRLHFRFKLVDRLWWWRNIFRTIFISECGNVSVHIRVLFKVEVMSCDEPVEIS